MIVFNHKIVADLFTDLIKRIIICLNLNVFIRDFYAILEVTKKIVYEIYFLDDTHLYFAC